MINKNSLVLYKKFCAVVTDFDGEKICIKFQVSAGSPGGKKAQYTELKVREKDIILLSEKAATSLEKALSYSEENFSEKIQEVWELLLSDDSTAKESISFSDLIELSAGTFEADKSWFYLNQLLLSLEFAQDEDALKNLKLNFIPRSHEEIESIKQKNYEKEHEAEIHAAFIKRLREKKLNLPDDARFMNEVENVAFCKAEKSKVMVEAGITQTPEKAHQLLIDTGIWPITKNPYPTRYGLSTVSAKEGLGTPPEEERLEVKEIAYAIDSPWSTDPDDAVCFDGKYLWVHIADPACYVKPDSSIDKVARDKGTTLYLPEGAVRMLAEESLPDYALGLQEKSRALSFRILLKDDNSIEECKIFKSYVNVKRLTYKEASEKKETPELKPLFEIAKKNAERRKKSGATNINLPEIHMSVDPESKKVEIGPLERYEADDMVCEMMLLAGEGAAYFAFNNGIPFPYVSQEAPEIPKDILPGLAGQFQLLRCMHKRSVGVTPGMHSGLGLALYSQVTSPLRRYGDLIAHQQLRAYLNGEKLLDKDTMLERISQGDAASVAARKASRQSETHWKLIYLLQNPEWTGKAICIDKKYEDPLFMIPSLALQSSIKGLSDINLNDEIEVKVQGIDITTQKVDFIKI
ncbi:MAG: RNB domain-containing ribonuclease [Treponema sp.]|nr:RNB domain-containing ribonuclease [Treponema sp.]